MNKHLINIFFIICFVNVTNNVVVAQTTLPLHDTLHNAYACYYKLDDKYSTSADSTEINLWWQNKLKDIELKGAQNSLFESKGGGPNGAQWNPSADLYVVATIKKVLTNESIVVELNKKKIQETHVVKIVPKDKIGTILYFKIQRTVWEKHLRKIKPTNAEEMYGVEISTTVKRSKKDFTILKGFFRVAYGE